MLDAKGVSQDRSCKIAKLFSVLAFGPNRRIHDWRAERARFALRVGVAGWLGRERSVPLPHEKSGFAVFPKIRKVGRVDHFHEVDQRGVSVTTFLHRHRRLRDQIVQIVRM